GVVAGGSQGPPSTPPPGSSTAAPGPRPPPHPPDHGKHTPPAQKTSRPRASNTSGMPSLRLNSYVDSTSRPACEELAECVEFAETPFGGGGQVGLDDREVGEAVEGAPAAAGGALLNLDRAD